MTRAGFLRVYTRERLARFGKGAVTRGDVLMASEPDPDAAARAAMGEDGA